MSNSSVNDNIWSTSRDKENFPESDNTSGQLPFQALIISLAINCILMSILSTLGIVTNSLNIAVFVRMRSKDGITVSFLGLSVADLLVSVGIIPMFCLLTMYVAEKIFSIRMPLQTLHFLGIGIFVPSTFSTMSSVITASLSVARCISVVRPIAFKQCFTSNKAIAIMIFGLSLAFVNIFVLVPATDIPNPANETLGDNLFSMSEETERLRLIVFSITRTGVSSLTFVILTVGVVVLYRGLRKSSKFRTTSAETNANLSDQIKSSEPASKRSSKDRQAVLQVLLISIMYLVTCSPMMSHVFVSQIAPDTYAMGRKHEYLFFAFVMWAFIFLQINSVCNIFIFHRYNSKYREIFKSFFEKSDGVRSK